LEAWGSIRFFAEGWKGFPVLKVDEKIFGGFKAAKPLFYFYV